MLRGGEAASSVCALTAPRKTAAVVANEQLALAFNLALGYHMSMKQAIAARQAGRELARLSIEARKARWGEEGFKRRLREWGRLGGRPKGSGKKQRKGGN